MNRNDKKVWLYWTAGGLAAAGVGTLLYRVWNGLSTRKVEMELSTVIERPAGKVAPAGEERKIIKGSFRIVQPKVQAGPVETASEDSFPASDPPSWTGTGL